MAWLRSDYKNSIEHAWHRFRFRTAQRELGLYKKPVEIEVYLSLNDPHSYMLVQALPELIKRYQIECKLLLAYVGETDHSVDRLSWQCWAVEDANSLALQYKLNTITQLPTPQSLNTGQQAWQLKVRDVASAILVFEQTWHNQWKEHYQPSTPVINYQIKNQMRQLAKGHYLTGNIFFADEWFLGIDRLNHLEAKFRKFSLQKEITAHKTIVTEKQEQALPDIEDANHKAIYFNRRKLKFQEFPEEDLLISDTVIEVFISLRSPYSYLGFKQVLQLANHYNVQIKIKPILPMVMRGLPVSKNKKIYIYKDTLREAKLLGIPFGEFTDPIGQGVINCYQLFSYAQHKKLAIEFIQAMFDAVNVKKQRLDDDGVMEIICQSIGLDYQSALDYALSNDWQQWVDENQMELEQMSMWGVPCFRYKNQCVWGQDRLWVIEQRIISEIEIAKAISIEKN